MFILFSAARHNRLHILFFPAWVFMRVCRQATAVSSEFLFKPVILEDEKLSPFTGECVQSRLLKAYFLTTACINAFPIHVWEII